MASPENSKEPVRSRKTFWTPGRIVLTLAVLAGITALGLSSCNSTDQSNNGGTGVASSNGASKATAPNASAPNSSAPAANSAPVAFIPLSQTIRDTKVQTLDGQSLKLADYNNKVLVVNIWATWCGPCQQEMPELVKMNNEYKSRGLVVLGLATTYNEHQGQEYVKNFIRAKGINYKIVWDDGSLTGPLVQSVNGRGVIPQSFVISRDGRILKHFEGFSQYSTPTLMRQAVEQALSEKS